MISKEAASILALYVYTELVDPINLPKLPYEGWTLKEHPDLPGVGPNGFAYGVFENQSTGEIVISYRGTDGAIPGFIGSGDGINNFALSQGYSSSQGHQAAQVYARVLQLYGSDVNGSNISFTGHSLGGGLASIMGVWFNRPAIVFDPAPFRATAESQDRVNQIRQLLGGDQAPLALRNYTPANDYAARISRISGYYAIGEFLETLAVVKRTEENSINLGAIQGVQFGNQNVSDFAMHSQALLSMGLLSDTFRQATVQVQNTLPVLLSTKYYSEETRKSTRKNFLLDLIRSEQSSPYNSKLDHFANDLSKLGTNLAGMNKAAQEAILAQGIEWYYWQSNDYAGQEFISVSNSVLQYTSAQGEGNLTGALNKANLYTTPWLTALFAQTNQQPIKTDYQQWNVATSAGGTATARDANKEQIFIGNGNGADDFTGGNKDDAFIGGDGDDKLDGQGGNDKLYGGAGSDTYKFTENFGKDTILDSDGSGSIQIGTDTLGKFEGNGGSYAFKLASGEYAGLVIRDDQSSTLTKKTAYIVKGTNQDNVITIKNFDLAKAQGSEGYLGIKLGTQKVALIQGDGKTLGATATNYWGDINSAASALTGKTSTFGEGAGKIFTISLAVAAGPGAKIVLAIAGALFDGLKAILGDSTVDANGAEITLAEGQTFVSFSLVSDSEITADQLGGISAQYQIESNDPNGSAGQSPVSSNTWGLTLRDAGEQDNSLRGDYTVKVDTTDTSGAGLTRIIRSTADGQTITIWREGEQRYFLDGQNNLIADAAGQFVTDNVISGNAGNDKIEGLGGSDHSFATNSIANYVEHSPGKCLKRFKNRSARHDCKFKEKVAPARHMHSIVCYQKRSLCSI